MPDETPLAASTDSNADNPLALVKVADTHYLVHGGPDMINARLRSGEPWESHTQLVARLLLTHVQRPVVFDIGANIGAFSSPIGRWLKSRGGTLHAFDRNGWSTTSCAPTSS